MDKRKKITIRLAISTDKITELLFIIFYSMPFCKWVLEQILGPVNTAVFDRIFILTILYATVFVLCVVSRQYLIVDFVGLLILIVFYFLLTYMVHPEYQYVYTREQYGVWEYVLRPDNGIYAYLFVRLISQPKRLIRSLKTSGYLMYGYSALRLYLALSRGYWIEENYLGESIHLSYSLNFGYSLVIFVCCFIYCAIKEKKIRYFILAGAGIVMIFLGGSRGPLLNIAIFIAIYILISISESRKKILYLIAFTLATIVLLLSYRQILMLTANILDMLNLPSRTITKLLDGSIAEDNGRTRIWMAAVDMIKSNPFGYGAMGARHGLYNIHVVGHPHNVFLEILIEYGVFLGPVMIIWFFVNSIRIFIAQDLGEWKYVYLIFFAYASQLLTSYTYWHSTGLWAVLAVMVCIHEEKKGTKKRTKKGLRERIIHERKQNL